MDVPVCWGFHLELGYEYQAHNFTLKNVYTDTFISLYLISF